MRQEMPAKIRATKGEKVNNENINNDRSGDNGSVLLHNSDNSVGNHNNHCQYSALLDHATADDDDDDDNNKENASNKSDRHRNGSRKLEAKVDQANDTPA